MSEAKDLLDRMPLEYRRQIEAEVNVVWDMKRQAEEDNQRLRAHLAKLEPIVDLAAKWYLAGDKQPQAQRDLEDALHLYLELT